MYIVHERISRDWCHQLYLQSTPYPSHPFTQTLFTQSVILNHPPVGNDLQSASLIYYYYICYFFGFRHSHFGWFILSNTEISSAILRLSLTDPQYCYLHLLICHILLTHLNSFEHVLRFLVCILVNAHDFHLWMTDIFY